MLYLALLLLVVLLVVVPFVLGLTNPNLVLPGLLDKLLGSYLRWWAAVAAKVKAVATSLVSKAKSLLASLVGKVISLLTKKP